MDGSNSGIDTVFYRGGWTAFHVAVYLGLVEFAQLLLDKGANVNAVFGEERQTSLHAACYRDLVEMVSLLVTATAIDINAVDLKGRTAVDYCAYYDHTSCLEALLDAGADPRLNGCKSLCYAVCRCHEAAAMLLIERGGIKRGEPLASLVFYDHILAGSQTSSFSLTGTTNRSAILIAAYNGFPESYQSLLKAGSKAAVDAEQSSWQGVERTRA